MNYKSPNLRTLSCVICHNVFTKYLTDNAIKNGKGKVCSMKCKAILNSISKKKGYYRKCVKCGKSFYHKPSEDKRGGIHKYCSRQCAGLLRKEKKMSSDGYWIIHTPSGEMKEHRFLMEQHISRKLLPTEIVHHINFDQLDNRIENLTMVSRSEHNKIHKFLSL